MTTQYRPLHNANNSLLCKHILGDMERLPQATAFLMKRSNEQPNCGKQTTVSCTNIAFLY